MHLKSIDEPELPAKTADITGDGTQVQLSSSPDAVSNPLKNQTIGSHPPTEEIPNEDSISSNAPGDDQSWPTKFTETLTPLLSPSAIEKLREMFLQGPEPPFVSDNGWGNRESQAGDGITAQDVTADSSLSETPELQNTRGKGNKKGRRDRDKSRRGRDGRRARGGREDNRKVLSDVRIQPILRVVFLYIYLTLCQDQSISSKQDRTALHEIIRTLFQGKLETETSRSDAESDTGQRIVIKWSKSKGGNVKRGNKDDAIARGMLYLLHISGATFRFIYIRRPGQPIPLHPFQHAEDKQRHTGRPCPLVSIVARPG